jgi:probable F420-dependent oxidoreductase
MKLGLRLPQRIGTDLRRDIVDTARTAERAGFDSVWAWERLLFPVAPRDPGPDYPDAFRQAADPLAVLTAAAVVTERVRLGTSVMIAGLHPPLQLAKSFAMLDQISGGRAIAGLGSGWSVEEFEAVGREVTERGALLDETLDVLAVAWGADPVSYHGRHTRIEEAIVLPKPVAHIPVLLGGDAGSARVRRRIARRADGWLPFFPVAGEAGARKLRADWDRIRSEAADAGRDATAMELVAVGNVTFTTSPGGADRAGFTGTLDQILEDVAAVGNAGADELIIDLNLQDWWQSTAQMLDTALEIREAVS